MKTEAKSQNVTIPLTPNPHPIRRSINSDRWNHQNGRPTSPDDPSFRSSPASAAVAFVVVASAFAAVAAAASTSVAAAPYAEQGFVGRGA